MTKIKNCVNFDLNSGSIERLVRNICFIRDIQISPRQYLNIPRYFYIRKRTRYIRNHSISPDMRYFPIFHGRNIFIMKTIILVITRTVQINFSLLFQIPKPYDCGIQITLIRDMLIVYVYPFRGYSVQMILSHGFMFSVKT